MNSKHFDGPVTKTTPDHVERPRIAVIFDMFGPYHIARLDALGRTVPTLGLELAARSSVYAWDKVAGETKFERLTLFEVEDSSLLKYREIYLAIAAALNAFRPQVVFIPGWYAKAALAATSWCLDRGVPSVVMSESTYRDAKRESWKEFLKRRVVACHGAALVGGTPQRDYLEMLGMPPEAVALGYNAVDNDYFAMFSDNSRQRQAELRDSLNLPVQYFLASARFVPSKNLMGLLKAFAEFRRLRPLSNIQLIILGDGPERGALEAKRAELGLEHVVLMPGFKQYEDLPTYYGLARAFVHVSKIEPWGLVVNEAMAAALPVVVSTTCGCANDLVIAGRNGFVVAFDDHAQVAARLADLDDAPPSLLEHFGANSRRLIAGWGAERFAAGAMAAANVAMQRGPARGRGLTRAVVAALAATS